MYLYSGNRLEAPYGMTDSQFWGEVPPEIAMYPARGNTRGSARLRSEAIFRRAGDPVSRPFLHDTRLFFSDQDSPFARGRHHPLADHGSRILLFTRQLETGNMSNDLLALVRAMETQVGP